MRRRRKRIIPGLAQKMSREVRDVSLLTHALHDLRLALHRLGREIVVCLVVVICTWQLLWEFFVRLTRALF
jgi:hypothetical protein